MNKYLGSRRGDTFTTCTLKWGQQQKPFLYLTQPLVHLVCDWTSHTGCLFFLREAVNMKHSDENVKQTVQCSSLWLGEWGGRRAFLVAVSPLGSVLKNKRQLSSLAVRYTFQHKSGTWSQTGSFTPDPLPDSLARSSCSGLLQTVS